MKSIRDNTFAGILVILAALNLILSTYLILRPLPTAALTRVAAEIGRRDVQIILLKTQLRQVTQQSPIPQNPCGDRALNLGLLADSPEHLQAALEYLQHK